MPIKSIKEKITSMASGEILGESDKEIERAKQAEKSEKTQPKKAPKEKKQKQTKKKKVKKEKTKKPKEIIKEEKVSLGSFFKRKEDIDVEPDYEEEDEVVEEEETVVGRFSEELEKGYKEVLSLYGIKENSNLTLDFTSNDLDYVEFSQTTPVGFDFEEVTDFISRTKYIMSRLENAVKQRDKDVKRLASEIKKIEGKMAEAKASAAIELTLEEKEIIGRDLHNENMELNYQIKELQQKVIEGSSDEVRRLKRELEVAKAHNKMLENEIHNQREDILMSPEIEGLPSIADNLEMPSLDDEVKEERKGLPSLEEL